MNATSQLTEKDMLLEENAVLQNLVMELNETSKDQKRIIDKQKDKINFLRTCMLVEGIVRRF